MLSMHANKPGSLNLPYPESSSLEDTQEFEIKRTMSGFIEKPKNRFSENKKWVINWERLTSAQLFGLEAFINSGLFAMIDPLGRSCIVKPMDFRPFHTNGSMSENGEMLSGAMVELLVVNANHALYVPQGVPLSTPANSPEMMPTLSPALNKTPLYGGNEMAFGPVIEGELAHPPLEWNRSARSIPLPNSGQLPVLRSPALAGNTACVYFSFQTQSD